VPGWLFSLIALVAIANGALLFLVMASRVAYGLDEAHLLPTAFGRVLPKRRTPWVSILAVAGVTLLLTMVGDIATLASTTVLMLLLVFVSANISVLMLKKDRVEHPHFSVPRIVPLIAIIASIVLLTQQTGIVWLGSAVYILVGSALFLVARFGRRREERGAREGAAPDASDR